MKMTNHFYSYQELSERWHRSPKTIWRWYAVDKILPQPRRVFSKVIGWPEADVEAFEAKHMKPSNNG